jgi:hypothetical protein
VPRERHPASQDELVENTICEATQTWRWRWPSEIDAQDHVVLASVASLDPVLG